MNSNLLSAVGGGRKSAEKRLSRLKRLNSRARTTTTVQCTQNDDGGQIERIGAAPVAVFINWNIYLARAHAQFPLYF